MNATAIGVRELNTAIFFDKLDKALQENKAITATSMETLLENDAKYEFKSDIMLAESKFTDMVKDSNITYLGKKFLGMLRTIGEFSEVKLPATRYNTKLLNSIRVISQQIESTQKTAMQTVSRVKDEVNLDKDAVKRSKVIAALEKAREADVTVARLKTELERKVTKYSKDNVIAIDDIKDLFTFVFEYIKALAKLLLALGLALSSANLVGYAITGALGTLAAQAGFFGTVANVIIVFGNTVTAVVNSILIGSLAASPTLVMAMTIVSTIVVTLIVLGRITKTIETWLEGKYTVEDIKELEKHSDLAPEFKRHRAIIERLQRRVDTK